MIISRTPLRISFAGGGSDLPAFYRHEPAAVTSTAIDKYIYITVNKKFDPRIRASYSITEIVDSLDELKHGLIREALRRVGLAQELREALVANDLGSFGEILHQGWLEKKRWPMASVTVRLTNGMSVHRDMLR